jgi:hypothetical protein
MNILKLSEACAAGVGRHVQARAEVRPLQPSGLPWHMLPDTLIGRYDDTCRNSSRSRPGPRGNADALATGMKQVATVADTILLRQTLQLISLTNDNYDPAYFPESETVGRILGLYRALRWS